MRDGSGVKSSIVKNKGEGRGTATPFISANDAHGVVGRRPRVRQQMYSLQQRAQLRVRASPGGTAAPGSWIHHVGVLNADRVLAPPATACAAGGDWVC